MKLYLEEWMAGGCVLCGGADRDGRVYAHDDCWRNLSEGEEPAVSVLRRDEVRRRCVERRQQQSQQQSGVHVVAPPVPAAAPPPELQAAAKRALAFLSGLQLSSVSQQREARDVVTALMTALDPKRPLR